MPVNKNSSDDSKRTRVVKTASVADTANAMSRKPAQIKTVTSQSKSVAPLTERETRVRMAKKYATTTFGFNTRKAFDSAGIGDVSNSSYGNFYSPQLSTDFLEKPQNLRERRAWYRHFYNANEFVGQAIDLHSTLPLSKIRLEKPKTQNPEMSEYVYDYFVDMCDDMKLFKTLLEVSHEFWLLGNCAEKNSRVRTPNGFKAIKDIEIGDEVLTHTNTFKKVIKKCSRDSDHIYNINLFESHRTIKLTGEHPVEVFRDGIFMFVKVEDLEDNDYIRLTYPSVTNDVESLNYLSGFSQIETTTDGTNKPVSLNSIEIDEDFCYLLGYWLGAGTLSSDNTGRQEWGRGVWNIVFGESSKEQLNKISTIIGNKLGTSSIKVDNNPAFIEWWEVNFGETCSGENNKKIPQWVYDLPKNKLNSLLAGMIDSDGTVTDSIAKITTVSESLAVSLFEIALKCNILVGTREYLTKPSKSELILKQGRNTQPRNCYDISLSNSYCYDTVGKYTIKNISEKEKEDNNSCKHKESDTGDFSYRIRSISKEKHNDLVYNLEVEKDHTYQVEGVSTHNCFIFAEDHNPYDVGDPDEESTKDKIEELKSAGRIKSDNLFNKFKIKDKDPNYLGWRKLIVLPPDQVRIKKVPLSDESLIEFIPDPETRKNILQSKQGMYPGDYFQADKNPYNTSSVPEKLAQQLEENGTIPLDTDPYSGSHVYHLARKKSQYETLGVSILERCVNTLLLQDKLRQAQTSIASRHMTPIRIVWGEGLSEPDVDNLREQVDLALVDPDFSIITNYQVNWEEMGSNGRLLELSGEYEHIENSLFAGLGVTREILTGEGTYSGSRVTLEIMNTQYLLYRELLQEYVENSLFKPVARKKGFVEEDKFGREKLVYPKLSFTRLAIRDNDEFFNQIFQLYNKGSVSIDVILDMLNIDAEATSKKVKADLFTVDDFAYNQLMSNMYSAAGQALVEKYNVTERLADYMNLSELEVPPEGGEGGGADMGGMPRFASTTKKKVNPKVANMDVNKKAALQKMLNIAMQNPAKLEKIMKYLESSK